MSRRLAELLRKAREVALYRGHKPPRVATDQEVASDPDFNSLMNNVGPAQEVIDMAIRRIAERTARDIEEQVMAAPRSYAQCADCGARAVARRGGIALCAEHLGALTPGRLRTEPIPGGGAIPASEASQTYNLGRGSLFADDRELGRVLGGRVQVVASQQTCPNCGSENALVQRGSAGDYLRTCISCQTQTHYPIS